MTIRSKHLIQTFHTRSRRTLHVYFLSLFNIHLWFLFQLNGTIIYAYIQRHLSTDNILVINHTYQIYIVVLNIESFLCRSVFKPWFKLSYNLCWKFYVVFAFIMVDALKAMWLNDVLWDLTDDWCDPDVDRLTSCFLKMLHMLGLLSTLFLSSSGSWCHELKVVSAIYVYWYRVFNIKTFFLALLVYLLSHDEGSDMILRLLRWAGDIFLQKKCS